MHKLQNPSNSSKSSTYTELNEPLVRKAYLGAETNLVLNMIAFPNAYVIFIASYYKAKLLETVEKNRILFFKSSKIFLVTIVMADLICYHFVVVNMNKKVSIVYSGDFLTCCGYVYCFQTHYVNMSGWPSGLRRQTQVTILAVENKQQTEQCLKPLTIVGHNVFMFDRQHN
uniref:Uncharacterized protein n=1 Tax=Glossina brevipalpis TaxID=37001 RepID=A0A1A9WU20_9MUSC